MKIHSSPTRKQESASSVQLPVAQINARIKTFNTELLAEVPKTSSGYQPEFLLRHFQNEAIDHIEAGKKSALVCAPTGSGKTVIAVAAMYRALKQGKKLIYTAPIKALSNQKITEFKLELANQFFNDPDLDLNKEDAYKKAEASVGLMTGDNTDNPEAPIKIMTTEVLNLVLSSEIRGKKPSEHLKNLSTIVFDEFHYLNDPDRGQVWEEAIINSPKDVQILGLSATVGNPEQVRDWINSIKTKRIAFVNEPEENRPVKLKYFHINKQLRSFKNFSARALDGDEVLEIKNLDGIESSINQLKALKKNIYKLCAEAKKNDDDQEFISKPSTKQKNRERRLQKKSLIKSLENGSLFEPESDKYIKFNDDAKKKLNKLKTELAQERFLLRIFGLVKLLHDNDKLPAIVFKFSTELCDKAAKRIGELQESSFQLLSADEQKRAKEIISQAKKNSPYLANEIEAVDLLEKGVASHHAGHLPQFKTLVEKLFEEGLIKVVFATSSLAAGINMPAKTTVLTELTSKGTGELSVSAFKQMAGRAGRPGHHDTEGNVFVFQDPGKEKETQKLIDSKPENIISKLKVDFTSVVNFIQAKDPHAFEKFLSQSFMRYQETHPLNDGVAKPQDSVLSSDLTRNFLKMKAYMTENGFVDKAGQLTDKGKISSCFKFNNPLFITDLLLKLSQDDRMPAELKSIRIDNFVALVSLLANDTGQENLEQLNNHLKKISSKAPVMIDLIARTMQESLNSLSRGEIIDNKPALNYEHFWVNQNWATAQKNIQDPQLRKRAGSNQAELFVDIVNGKKKSAEEETNDEINTVKKEDPGKCLRSIKQTLNLLKHMRQAVELRKKDDHRSNILSAELADLVKESVKLINKDIVADNKFDLSI